MSGFRALGFALLTPIWAGSLWAGDAPMSGEAFEAFVSGKAFSYARDGVVFGTEAYRAQRRVMWLGADGSCLAGSWIARAGEICFIYDADGSGVPRVCAPIYAMGAGLRAVEHGGAEVTGLPVAMPDLSACTGPKVGA
jgi:hypothetical protein